MRRVTGAGRVGRLVKAAALAGAALAPGGCAVFSDRDEGTPAWFQERLKSSRKEGFPSLAQVPQAVEPPRSAASWAAIEADLKRAEQNLETHPRSQPSPQTPEAAAAFEAAARREAEPDRAPR